MASVEYNREYYQNNKERIKEQNNLYYHENREANLLVKKALWQRNKNQYNKKRLEDYHSNKDKYLDRALRSKYGISLIDYDLMYDKQNGQCKSCGENKSRRGKRQEKLHVDHCHQTNKVRGLLCLKCNTSLGLLDENEEKIRSLLSYLKGIKNGISS